jgi:hypothetical protein
MKPCSPFSEERTAGEVSNQQDPLPAACVTYSSTLNMETECSSETPVNFCRTIQRRVSEHSTSHSHRYERMYLARILVLISGIWLKLFVVSLSLQTNSNTLCPSSFQFYIYSASAITNPFSPFLYIL